MIIIDLLVADDVSIPNWPLDNYCSYAKWPDVVLVTSLQWRYWLTHHIDDAQLLLVTCDIIYYWDEWNDDNCNMKLLFIDADNPYWPSDVTILIAVTYCVLLIVAGDIVRWRAMT